MHVPTLLYVMSAVTFFAAVMMMREAIDKKSKAPELFWWSAAFLCLTVGGLLSGLRTFHLDFLAYAGSNALIIAGYVLIWRGVREYCGERLSLAWLAAAPLWIAIYALTPLLLAAEQRVIGMSSVAVFVSVACALDLLAKPQPVRSARDLAVLFLAHAVFYMVRIVMVRSDGAIIDVRALTGLTFTVVIFEAVLFVVLASYLLLTMTRERAFLLMQAASETDYLTGIDNRRAFTAKAETILRQTSARGGNACLLLFDLDHFKQVNDLHGHAAGDEVLKLFCRIVADHLRPGELFGRMGGEEFAALLPGMDQRLAAKRAAAMKDAFSASARHVAGRSVAATVSIGIATAGEEAEDVTALLSAADGALYAAKLAGRDRIRLAERRLQAPLPPPLPVSRCLS